MMRFLRPDVVRLILFAVFLAIAAGGAYEARGFSEEGSGHLFGAWTIWMVLLAPLGLLLIAVDAIGPRVDLFRAAPVVFWGVQIAYFYLLACVIAAIAGAVRRRFSRVK
jgi:hypothetical protein